MANFVIEIELKSSFPQQIMKKIVFVVNPISGTKSKQRILDLIAGFFEPEQWAVEVKRTESPGHAERLANEAARSGADVVVAVGGDGTVNEVARGIVHTESALGIVPCGSGNGLARHLGIPMNPQKALRTLKRMDVRTCDYGLINGHPFFCTAGTGFDALVSDTFAHAGKRGFSTYVKTTLKVGLKYKGEKYDVEIQNDGTTRQLGTQRYWLVTAGNAAQYGNDFYITPGASLCDGKLNVNLWKSFNIHTHPLISSRLVLKNIGKSRFVDIVECEKIVIRRQTDGPIHWDGDPSHSAKDVTIEVVKAGIKMIAGKVRI